MATTKTEEKKYVVNLFYDGDKYKDPLFVGINDKTWLIQRGIDVEVPEEVYNAIMQQQEQDKKANKIIREMQSRTPNE